jgi:hypothetical protein
MQHKKYYLLILLAIGMLSCKKYLDIVPDSVATIENAFSMRNTAERYLFTCYSWLPDEANIDNNPALTAGDEFWFFYPHTGGIAPHGFQIARGNQNVVAPYANYWDGENGGKPLFRGIRECNIFLENIMNVPDMDDFEKKRWAAEARFLKAYYHFWLLRMYGPIPLMKTNMPVTINQSDIKGPRDVVDSCFSYIVQLLDEAAPDLPEVIMNETAELGRVTRPVALAVKARVLLTAASPLFNGNADYSAFKDGQKGGLFFNQEKSVAKWEKAAAACKEAIDFCHRLGMKLYTYHQAVPTYIMSPQTKIQMDIRNAVCDKWNVELIWGGTTSRASGIQGECMARLDATRIHYAFGSRAAAPLKIAEMFYTENGVPIAEDLTWDFAGRYNLKTGTAADKYLIKQGYQTAALHFDREPRFYADLGFDGGIWYGQGKYNDAATWDLQGKQGQFSGWSGTLNNYNITGYWPKKLVHFNNVIEVSSYTTQQYPWPMFRLAELYLSYAEALNEVNGPSAEALQYLDDVRARAGLTSVEESWTNFSSRPTKFSTQDGLREIIQQERLIELVFEGHRFWDLRRWKRGTDEWQKPITGWDISQKEAPAYYQQKQIFLQTFRPRDYFWPIKEKSLEANGNLVQNPGW